MDSDLKSTKSVILGKAQIVSKDKNQRLLKFFLNNGASTMGYVLQSENKKKIKRSF